jgi:trehalose 6-phosphate phosphatase
LQLSGTINSISDLMGQIAVSTASILLLDYDGTIAPFQTDRRTAYPYPEVIPILDTILKCGKSRVVIVTGRPVAEIGPLLRPLRNIEIWGSHGLERLLADGTYLQTTLSPETAALLSRAESLLNTIGLAHRTEIKPGGLAVHWRGLPHGEVREIEASAEKELSYFGGGPELKLLRFDGGLELRVGHPNKGDAVAAILGSSKQETPVAYLGDDITDEDAFRVLNPRGLTVLVRSEYRTTNAQIWLRPPHELISFLERWSESICGIRR